MEIEESREYYMDISAVLTQIGVTHASSPASQAQDRLSRKDTKNATGRRSPSANSTSPTGDEGGNTGGSTSRQGAVLPCCSSVVVSLV